MKRSRFDDLDGVSFNLLWQLLGYLRSVRADIDCQNVITVFVAFYPDAGDARYFKNIR